MGGIALVAIAGCSSGSATPEPSTTTTPAAPTTTAPKISNPLDLSKFAANVCAGWTDAQVTPYLVAVDGKDPGTSGGDPDCVFHPKDLEKPFLGLGVLTGATPTQEMLYEAAGAYPWRQKIAPIAGYPAVDASNAASGQGGCITRVAVNDNQNLNVSFTVTNPADPNYAKPCVPSEALMADLIQNIQAGG